MLIRHPAICITSFAQLVRHYRCNWVDNVERRYHDGAIGNRVCAFCLVTVLVSAVIRDSLSQRQTLVHTVDVKAWEVHALTKFLGLFPNVDSTIFSIVWILVQSGQGPYQGLKAVGPALVQIGMLWLHWSDFDEIRPQTTCLFSSQIAFILEACD